MLGSLISRVLLMVVGYAYPAYECFKTVEKNRVGIEELRFWCQYWIIVAALTVFERVGDIFVSWLPLYGEMKLGLFIFLWYPKTKGCGYVYTTVLRPFLAQHEKDVDQKLQELRTRAWDSAFHYGQNFAQTGQIKLFEIVHYVIGLSKKEQNEEKNDEPNEKEENGQQPNLPSKLKEHRSIKGISAPPSSPISSPSFQRATLKHRQLSEKKRPPLPSTGALNRSISQSSELETVQINRQTDSTTNQDEITSGSGASAEIDSGTGIDKSLLTARSRLRRSSSKGSQDM